MLIFSTIAAIISPIIYLIPFIILWKNEGHTYYAIPGTEKEIKNKHVFIAKIILLTILSVVFVFTWPKKVMFYPLKVAILIIVLVAIQFITFFTFLCDYEKNDKVSNKLAIISLSFWFVLLVLGIISLIFGGTIQYDIKVPEDSFKAIETLHVDNISNGNVFFYDESLEVVSISDDSLEIVLQENKSQQPYVEKITTYERYSKPGVKNKVIYDDMSTLSESYILYVSKDDLYK